MPLSKKDFRSRLVTIFNNLDPTHVRNLAFLAKGDYPIRNECSQNGCILLTELQQMDIVSRRKTAYLRKLLTIIGRKDLTKKLPRSFNILTVVNKYRVFLYRVFTELDDENVRNLRFCYRIPEGQVIKDGIDLCLWLLKKQDLTRYVLVTLAQRLKHIGRDALAEEVREYIKDNPEVTGTHRHLTDTISSLDSCSTASLQTSDLTDVGTNLGQSNGIRKQLENPRHIRDVTTQNGNIDGRQSSTVSQSAPRHDRPIYHNERTPHSNGRSYLSNEGTDDDDEYSDDENYYDHLKRRSERGRLRYRHTAAQRGTLSPETRHKSRSQDRFPSTESQTKRKLFICDRQEAEEAERRPVLVYRKSLTEFDSNNKLMRRSESLVTLDIENSEKYRNSQNMSDSSDDEFHRSESRTTLNVSLVDLSMCSQMMDFGDEGVRRQGSVSRGGSNHSRRSRRNSAAHQSRERYLSYGGGSFESLPSTCASLSPRSNPKSTEKDMEKCSSFCTIL